MQSSGGSIPGPYGVPYPAVNSPSGSGHHRWLYAGLAVTLGLVGVALFLVLLTPATFGYHPAAGAGYGPWGVFGGFFLVFLVVWIAIWAVRIGTWSSRTRGDYLAGRGRRYGFGAFAIARERYARGEITREEYQEIIDTLERRPGAPPLQ